MQTRPFFQKQNGFALTQAIMLTMISGIIIAATISIARYSTSQTVVDSDQDQCLLLANSALEKCKYDITTAFLAHYQGFPNAESPTKITWFDTINTNYSAPKDASYSQHLDANSNSLNEKWRKSGIYDITVDVKAPLKSDQTSRDVKIRVDATVGDFTRSFEEIVRFNVTSNIFNYSYFQNQPMFVNGGGSSLVFNGDIRSNGNMNIGGTNGMIAGDVYASNNPTFGSQGTGAITGNLNATPLATYNNNANTSKQARPEYTPSGPFISGYKGTSSAFPHESKVEVPALDDITRYQELAQSTKGQITQNGVVLVDGITQKTDVGYDKIAGTPDDGSVVLIGTAANPIHIDGVVVVDGDVMIKGKITGKGTIYTTRNIHVIDNLEYVNKPQWNKPNAGTYEEQLATYATNDKADLVAYVAKGNIILGNPENVINELKPLLTATYPHETVPSDAANGYDSDKNPDNGYLFNGQYNTTDGGKRVNLYERPETALNNNFYIPSWGQQTVATGYWTQEVSHMETRTRVIVNNSISSSSQVSEVTETYQVKVVDVPSTFVQTGTTTKPATEDRYWIDCNPKNLDIGNVVAVGDKILVNGVEYTVRGQSHQGGIQLDRPLHGESLNTQITSVVLKPRNRSLKDRKFYEPTITTYQMGKIAVNKPSKFDGFFFTNHLFGGVVTEIVVNGSVITRDSALKYTKATFNWDMRMGDINKNTTNSKDHGLPPSFSTPEVVYRREL